MRTLYIKCTTDKYELPIAVADSCNELSRMLGLSLNSVYSMISKEISGFHKIEVEDWRNDGSKVFMQAQHI